MDTNLHVNGTAKVTGASSLAGTVEVGGGYKGDGTGSGITLDSGGAANEKHK